MLELFMASVAAAAMLYVPGFLFFRALRFTNLIALVAAPIATTAVIGALPIIYYGAGIPCGIGSVLLAPAAAFGLMWAASAFIGRSRRTPVLGLPTPAGTWRRQDDAHDDPFDWAMLALYVLCGLAVCTLVFITALGAPDAFFSRYDNQSHLNVAQSFLDSGLWSSLHAGRYFNVPAEMNAFYPPSGFYPAAWHALVALTCLATGCSVTLASNALVTVFASIVFPAAMFALIRSLFPANRGVIAAGALAAVGFSTYPWIFPIKGPTLPNMYGFAVMTAFMAMFIAYLEQGLVRGKLAGFALFCLTAFVAMAISHTNALFTAFVFLAAYGGHYLVRLVGRGGPHGGIPRSKRLRYQVCAITLYCALLCAFWAVCLNLPFLQAVITYHHIENKPLIQGIGGLLTLKLTVASIQATMVVASLAGVIVCLRRRLWWLLLPVAFMSIAYVAARCSIQPFLTIFAGLWYSLPYRVAACLSIYLMPVAALGLAAIVRGAVRLLQAHPALPRWTRNPLVSGGAIVALFIALTFPPLSVTAAGFELNTPFDDIREQLATIYDQDGERVYGAEEVAFVERAKQEIPEGALLLNQPHDGSVFAYGVNHVNVYYRSSSPSGQKPEAQVIRERLADYAADPQVQDAVAATGARYLLKLDQGVPYEEGIWLPQYAESTVEKWAGINAVDDDTPGFAAVLSDGDMRLYRIG